MLSAIQIAGFLNQAFIQSKSMKQHFLHVHTNSQNLKVDQKVFGGGMAKNECNQSGLWTLKLTVSQEQTGDTN